jgi:hypothetical protein
MSSRRGSVGQNGAVKYGLRRLLLGAMFAALGVALASSGAFADEWLVYVGGGVEEIEGGWEERNGLVLFTMRGGALVSVPFHDVDLPTSAFITWQLGGRRTLPPRAEVQGVELEGDADPGLDCVSAQVLAVEHGETLRVMIGEEQETIHLACLDTPETQHQFEELQWFGRATLSAVQIAVKPGAGPTERSASSPAATRCWTLDE